ncbi:ribonucleotide reductase flavodoxin [Staphylococcus phage MarsHill]|nr:ribonucleotide reductase flavodoxin [Staphylococcus phage MarsHill]QQO92731.1 ribonucleotide reductase flavodoxin [Staphylococcus phage Madawaska]
MKLLYFSLTGNSKKFAEKLDSSIVGEPIELNRDNCDDIKMNEEYVLVCGSYNTPHAIYNHVEKFFNNGNNLELCKGIIGSGNRNLNYQFLTTPKRLCSDFNLELIAGVELFGIKDEHLEVNKKLKELSNSSIIN